jgi:hypothetical protein
VGLLVLTSCGYQLQGRNELVLPGGAKRLYLARVDHPSSEPWMEPTLRTSLREELARRGDITWTERADADLTLSLRVIQYGTGASVTGRDDITLKSQAVITLELIMREAATGAVVWNSGPITVAESYRGLGSQQGATERAIAEAMRRIADRLQPLF